MHNVLGIRESGSRIDVHMQIHKSTEMVPSLLRFFPVKVEIGYGYMGAAMNKQIR